MAKFKDEPSLEARLAAWRDIWDWLLLTQPSEIKCTEQEDVSEAA